MPAPVNLGDSTATVKQKIIDILAYHNLSTAEITSWGVARTRLNFAATSLGLATFADSENGSTVRTKINAVNSAPSLSSPTNAVAPNISGTSAVGQTLTASNGTWTGHPTPTYSRQWRRNGAVISGETETTYTLTDEDMGSIITVSVTATNNQGFTTVTSAGTSEVVAPPVNEVAPTISGDAYNGQTLTATEGTWTGYPTPIFTFQWKSDGTNISGATSSTLLLGNDQVGKEITVEVTATNSEGVASITSVGTDLVISEPINTVAPTISGNLWPDELLTVNRGTWVGYPAITYSYQWKRSGVDIVGQTSTMYTVIEDDLNNEISVSVTATNSESSDEVETIGYYIAPEWAQGVTLWQNFQSGVGTDETINNIHSNTMYVSKVDGSLVKVNPNVSTVTDRGLASSALRTNLVGGSAKFDNSNTYWNRTNGSSITSVTSIFDTETAYRHTGTGAEFQSRNQAIASMPQNTVVSSSVILEEGNAEVTVFGILSRLSEVNTWRVRVALQWSDLSLSVTSGTQYTNSLKLTQMGVGPNGGRLVRVEVTTVTPENGPTYTFFIYPSGETSNTLNTIIHHAQVESGVAASPPILSTTTGPVVGNGNRVYVDITGMAEEGIAGVVQFELGELITQYNSGRRVLVFSSGDTTNTVELNVSSNATVNFYQLRAVRNSQPETTGATMVGVLEGISTVAFAIGPNFARYHVIGKGSTVLDTSVDYPGEEINVLGINSYGFTNSSTVLGFNRKLALKFGPVDSTVFSNMVTLAEAAASEI